MKVCVEVLRVVFSGGKCWKVVESAVLGEYEDDYTMMLAKG